MVVWYKAKQNPNIIELTNQIIFGKMANRSIRLILCRRANAKSRDSSIYLGKLRISAFFTHIPSCEIHNIQFFIGCWLNAIEFWDPKFCLIIFKIFSFLGIMSSNDNDDHKAEFCNILNCIPKNRSIFISKRQNYHLRIRT